MPDRHWYIGGHYIASEEVSVLASIKWLCTSCGEEYARAVTYDNDTLCSYSFIHGCCPKCLGNRFFPSGSLECLALVGWKVPLPVALYQLNIELNFLSSKDHPHNAYSPS